MISKRTYHITTSLKLDEWGAMFLFINCEQSSQAQSLKEAISKGQASKPDLKVCCPQRQSVISGRGPRPHLEVLSINIKLQSTPSTYRSSSRSISIVYIFMTPIPLQLSSQVDAQSQIISRFSKYEHWPTMGYIIWDNFLSRSNTLLLLMVVISVLFSISLQSIHENW